MGKQQRSKQQETREQEKIKKHHEKLLRKYFDNRRRPWLKWLISIILLVMALYTALDIWWPTYAMYYVPLLQAAMEQPVVKQVYTYLVPVINKLNPIWTPFSERIERLPTISYVYQFLNIPQADRTSFLLGIGLPTVILVFYLFIQLLSGVFNGIRRLFTRRSSYEYTLDDDNTVWEDITADQKVLDTEIDKLLRMRVNSIVEQSLKRLSIKKSELAMNPIIVRAPIMWRSVVTPVVDSSDMRWRRGKDGRVRFGVYRVLVLHLTKRYMGIFSCYYNFIRNHTMNESFKQHLYDDVVSVSLSDFDDDIALTLPSGKTLKLRRQFRIVFKNDQKITVTTNARRLSQEAGTYTKFDEDTAEDAVRLINRFLRDRSSSDELRRVS